MNKSIKVEESTYERLMQMKHGNDTFALVVERLVRLHDLVLKGWPLIDMGRQHPADKTAEVDPMREARLERADLDTRTLK